MPAKQGAHHGLAAAVSEPKREKKEGEMAYLLVQHLRRAHWIRGVHNYDVVRVLGSFLHKHRSLNTVAYTFSQHPASVWL